MARLLMVFVVMSIVTGIISIYFPDDYCPDGVIKVIEGSGSSLRLYSDGILSPLSVINWTLVPDTGSTRQLAVCYRNNNCTFYSGGYSGYAERYGFKSSVGVLRDVPKNLSGTALCSEVGENTEETASCRVDVIRAQISDGYVRDEGPGLYTCYHARYSPYTVTWTLTTDTGQTLHLGTCNETNQCTSPYDPAVRLSGHTGVTKAYFNSIQRNTSGTLFCSYTYDGFTDTDQTLLNIYHPPTLDNCHVDIINRNWSAVLHCDVSRMFSSTGIYEYEIGRELMISNTTAHGIFKSELQHQLTSRLSFRHDLSSYIDHTTSKQYYRGHLSRSWKLSPDPSWNLLFTLSVYCGSHTSTQRLRNSFRIEKPTRPRLNCSDSSYVPEHEVQPCVCTADNLGLPSGRLIWLLGDTVITTGAYGANQILLPSTAVTRRQEPMLAVCMLDWIEPLNATFLWNVAYGPDSVDLQVSFFYDVTDTAHVLITCHVSELKPVSSSTVQWTGPCQGQAGFRCTVPLSVAEGQEVRCLVTNHANNGQSSEAATVIKLHGRVSTQTQPTQTQPTQTKATQTQATQTQTAQTQATQTQATQTQTAQTQTAQTQPTQTQTAQTQADSSEFKCATYALGTALGIIAIVLLIVVMFILGRRGHLSKCICCGPVYDSPKHNRPQRNQSGDSTDLHEYEVVSNTAATGNQSEVMSSGPVYENSLVEQEGHI